ncbi:hypothetical protein AB9K35_20075 [Leisingera sp. XS_AS12]|uniref:hypothetical protein n=1 Tax=Leisingera sp. XS_AS12 TaxID=3241294 RepID=UPI003512CF4E
MLLSAWVIKLRIVTQGNFAPAARNAALRHSGGRGGLADDCAIPRIGQAEGGFAVRMREDLRMIALNEGGNHRIGIIFRDYERNLHGKPDRLARKNEIKYQEGSAR